MSICRRWAEARAGDVALARGVRDWHAARWPARRLQLTHGRHAAPRGTSAVSAVSVQGCRSCAGRRHCQPAGHQARSQHSQPARPWRRRSSPPPPPPPPPPAKHAADLAGESDARACRMTRPAGVYCGVGRRGGPGRQPEQRRGQTGKATIIARRVYSNGILERTMH